MTDWKAILKSHRENGEGPARFGGGLDPATDMPSVAIYDHERKPCGIWLCGERPACVAGSKPGLFIPKDLELTALPELWRDPYALLIVTVGWPTTRAASACGVPVLGMSGWAAAGTLIRFLIKGEGQDLALIVDRDGIAESVELCDALLRAKACGRLRFCMTPEGESATSWIESCGVALAAEAARAVIVTPLWIGRARRRLYVRMTG